MELSLEPAPPPVDASTPPPRLARISRCGRAFRADELVKLTLATHRRDKGVAQRQAPPLQFRGAVKDPLADTPRGINVRAALAALGKSLTDLRDKALLSVAYDTGLRASELVVIDVAGIVEAIDPDARLLQIARSKGDQEGEGATGSLSAQRDGDDSLARYCRD